MADDRDFKNFNLNERNMTPKETAKRLFLEYAIIVTSETNIDNIGAVICAKKSVKFLLSAYENVLKYDDNTFLEIDVDYYKNVLKELDNMNV